MKKVYIAGKIKGLPANETEQKFSRAEDYLKKMGCTPINPFQFVKEYNKLLVLSGGVPLSDENTKQRKEILKMCIGLLIDCDQIFLCGDWQESEGATFEKQVADFFDIQMYSE